MKPFFFTGTFAKPSWPRTQEDIDRAFVAYRDAHRKKWNDLQWAAMQPKGPPNYFLGDVVRFKVGGIGCINEVSKPHDGWPSSYSASPIPGHHFHAKGVSAWHYEGDFKCLVAGSPLRGLKTRKRKDRE